MVQCGEKLYFLILQNMTNCKDFFLVQWKEPSNKLGENPAFHGVKFTFQFIQSKLYFVHTVGLYIVILYIASFQLMQKKNCTWKCSILFSNLSLNCVGI